MKEKIFITGASGFIGKAAVATLINKGYDIASWRHRPGANIPEHLRRTRMYTGDLSDLNQETTRQLREALSGARTVLHLAAKTPEAAHSRNEFQKHNVDMTQRLIAAAQEARVERFIFVSTQSVTARRLSDYAQSKKTAEEAVQQSGLDYVIVRPAIVYGPGDLGLFAKLVRLINAFPVIPFPDSPAEFQPVLLDDVARTLAGLVESNGLKLVDIAGPDAVTLKQWIGRIAQVMNKQRLFIPIPMPVAFAGARTLSLILKKPPITVDNLRGLAEASRVDIGSMRGLGIEPLPLAEGLRRTFAS
ncbi:MAG: NAD-dependent epimerase/dehydratase family protein [Elusimicrobia bacterium]|nr:NAD-dependent epimerase/dehydratase family protein [Elusimicrobiota bacterium]